MPQETIPVLQVADAGSSVTWYERLGFSKEWEERAEDGSTFVSIARGHARIYLSEREADAGLATLLYIRHSHLDDVAGALDSEIRNAPRGRQIEVTDPDGHRLRISEAHD